MKKISIVLLSLCIQAAVYAQTHPILKYIPDDAGMIMSFDPVQIAKKVPGETFRQSGLYQELMKNDMGEIKAFLSDPSVSGIDFSKTLVVVISNEEPEDRYSKPLVRVFGAIKNESLFAMAVKKLGKDDDSVQAYGTNKILYSKDDQKPRIGWNNEIFVLVAGMSKAAREEMLIAYPPPPMEMLDTTVAMIDTATLVAPDTTTKFDEEGYDKEQEKKYREALQKVNNIQREEYFALLTPRPSGAIATNAIIADLFKSDGDIKMWNNGKGALGAVKQMPPPLAAVFSKLTAFASSNKTSVVNFENGKIVSHSRNFINTDMAEVYKKYPSPSLNMDMFRRLPKGQVLGMFMASANTGMAKEMMQKTGLADLIEEVKGKIPFNLDLITSSLKNSMMVAVMKSDDPEMAGGKMGGIQLIMAMPIADKAKFQELKKSVLGLLDSLKSSEKGVKVMKDINPVVKDNDNMVVFALSESTAQNFLKDPGTNPVPEWLQAKANYPMLMSLNFKEVLAMVLTKGGRNDGKDEEAKKILDKFDQVLISGGHYENGSLNSTLEFKFSNPNENAMKQLFDFVNMAAEASGKNKRKRYDLPPPSEEAGEVIQEGVKEETPVPPPPPPPKEPKKKTQPVKKTKG